jgi:hypothetical protein
MTTKEDYLKLGSLIDQIDTKLKKKEEQVKEAIQSYDYYRGYRNGINIVQMLESNGTVSDKKPETLRKLDHQIETKYKMYVENCNMMYEYPSSANMNSEFMRGQIMGMNDSSKILFKYDCLKQLKINIELLKTAYTRNR